MLGTGLGHYIPVVAYLGFLGHVHVVSLAGEASPRALLYDPVCFPIAQCGITFLTIL